MRLEFINLARHGLLEDVGVAEAAEVAVAPSIDHAISCHSTRVIISSLDLNRHLSVFVSLKGAWIELIGYKDVLAS